MYHVGRKEFLRASSFPTTSSAARGSSFRLIHCINSAALDFAPRDDAP
jgi:hypothetical protein